jgi:hypothetical protein
MDQGAIVAEGDPTEVLTNPLVVLSYLGTTTPGTPAQRARQEAAVHRSGARP